MVHRDGEIRAETDLKIENGAEIEILEGDMNRIESGTGAEVGIMERTGQKHIAETTEEGLKKEEGVEMMTEEEHGVGIEILTENTAEKEGQNTVEMENEKKKLRKLKMEKN